MLSIFDRLFIVRESVIVVSICRGLFFITLFTVTCLAIFPGPETAITTGWDKANHVIAFMVLLALMDVAFPVMPLYKFKIPLLLLYGLCIEGVQGFLPDRSMSMLDVAADMVGLVGYLILRPWLCSLISPLQSRHIE